MDISFADDDEPIEHVRQEYAQPVISTQEPPTTLAIRANGGSNTDETKTDIKNNKSAIGRPGFNPTEAILATMQLLPLPCATAGLMTPDEIERNVSVIRSFAQGQQLGLNVATCTPLRRKSKSQMGLNDLRDDGKTSSPAICDLDELRSFQRQLQNFPSLSELRRYPLQSRQASTSSYRRSLSPATSSRWLEASGQGQETDAEGMPPLSTPVDAERGIHQKRSSPSRSTSRSSNESRGAQNTDTYALCILQILQV